MFSPVSWQWYLKSTQNNLQSAKNRTGNAIKLVSKPSNKRYTSYLGNDTLD